MSPTNRRERRFNGWTEGRLRKIAAKGGLISRIPAEQPKSSISALTNMNPAEAMTKEMERRYDRVDGKPRRWQVERARRRA